MKVQKFLQQLLGIDYMTIRENNYRKLISNINIRFFLTFKYNFIFFFIASLYAQNSPLYFYSQEVMPTEIIWIEDDLSGCTRKNDNNSLYMIENDQGKIWELDTNFNHLRTILGGHFGDEEDLVYLNNEDFAIVTEEGHLFIGSFPINDNNIEINNFQKITFSNHDGNTGPEGVAYDSLSQTFFIVKEKNPMAFYIFQRPSHNNDTTITVTIPFDAEIAFYGIMDDLSSITYDYRTNRVLILSDDSQKVIDVEPTDGSIFGEMIINGMEQPEGICFLDNYDLLFVSEPNFYTIYSNFSLFGDINFDGQINYYDIELIIEYLYGHILLTEYQKINVDIDYNHNIDIFDILLIMDISDN